MADIPIKTKADSTSATSTFDYAGYVTELVASGADRAAKSLGLDLRSQFIRPLENLYSKVVLPGLEILSTADTLPASDKTTASDIKKGFSKLNERMGSASTDKITLDELDRNVSNQKISGSEAQMLVVFKKMLDRFRELDPDCPKDTISQKAINKFEEIREQVATGKFKEGSKEFDLVKDVNDELKRIDTVFKETNRKLFANEKEPEKSVNIEGVRQGPIGNCYFYGAVGAQVVADRKAIVALLEDSKDGTFKVKYPGKKAIDTEAPTDAELALFPKPGKDGVWMWVLEKAYGLQCIHDPGNDNPATVTDLLSRAGFGKKQSCVAQERTEGPSFVDDGLRILTGKNTTWIWNKYPDDLHKSLKDNIGKVPITCDSHLGVLTDAEKGPIRWHTYSVIGYDADSKTITIRNPWGYGPPTCPGMTDLGDGKCKMSLATFCKWFSKISHPIENT